ncbi:MAG: putative replicase [Cressdnaviricota sp.]|nr:MAG: putative replicase [Cressdnaviricota sp.]
MEYLNKILKNPITILAGDLLVESPAQNGIIDGKAIYASFNNYDMALTINLKGSHNPTVEKMKGDIHKQYEYLVQLYKEHIIPHCSNYVAHFELHKCGEFIHTHAIISIVKPNKTQQAKAIKQIRSEVFKKINNRKLKPGETYKNRIHLEKVFTVETWYDYIKKDEIIMRKYDDRIRKLYKLQSINTSKTTSIVVSL